jgi:hypothetical protein
MYKVTTIFQKPDADIPYFLETQPALREEFFKFSSSEPSLLLVNVLDESATRQISEAFYADESAFDIFIAKFNTTFPTFFADRDAYHASVGVVTTREATTI